MNRWAIGLVALGGTLMVGTGLQAHHSVAGVYDLHTEVVLEGQLAKLNVRNPHSNIVLTVPNPDGTTTEWTLTTATVGALSRQGVTRTTLKPGEPLKVTVLPARNGDAAGFIRSLEFGDRGPIDLVIE